MKITEKEFNVQTGKETITQRDATADEIAKYQAAEALAAETAKSKLAAQAARQALLDKLGITADEARLLLGND